MSHNSANLIGQKFNRLLVLFLSGIREESPSPKRGKHVSKRRVWECLCDCGNKTHVTTRDLRTGNTGSCGCLNKERITKHNQHQTQEYRIWAGMKDRCGNPNSPGYKNYGGRGIKVCERWFHSFENFINDLGKRPSKYHTLDRIDNNGNYSPENCHWVTWDIQNRNHRRNRIIEYRGKEMCQSDWAKEMGMHPRTLCDRLQRGWFIEDALTTPVKKKKHKS